MSNNLNNIVRVHNTSRKRLEQQRSRHAANVEVINEMLFAGRVEGVSFRVGSVAIATSGSYDMREFMVENIYLKYDKAEDLYTVQATGPVIKMDGKGGRARTSASMNVQMPAE